MMTSNSANRLAFSTRVIHAGQYPDPSTGAVMMPIYATSTFVQESPGVHKGYEYARSQNPTRMAFERCIADLESGTAGFAFASGLAGISTLLETLDAGAHVVASDDLYGGSFRLFERVRKRSAGLRIDYVDLADMDAVAAAVRPETKLIWIETPTNPMLKLVDLEAIARFAKERGIRTVADNTFASPWVQRPIELGIDAVVHSTTKYLNGHSDMVGGTVVVGENAELRDQMKFLQNAVGAISGPFDSFLALRGLKTLALRMERHCANALELARWLETRPEVQARDLSGAGKPSAARVGAASDERLRRHRDGRAECRAGRDEADAGADAVVLAGGKLGRSGKPDRASGDHDPRDHSTGSAPSAGHQRRADPAVGRGGGRVGPAGGSGNRPEGGFSGVI